VLLREPDINFLLDTRELIENKTVYYPGHIVIINFKDYLKFLKPNIFRSPEERLIINKMQMAWKLGLDAINSEHKFNKLINENKRHLRLLKKFTLE
jgi:hypothetical protein